jgi:hypothetical protein
MIAFAEKYADASVSVKIYTERINAMKVKCNEVVLGNRFRKNVGELDGLMESIRLLGLLQPMVNTSLNDFSPSVPASCSCLRE